MGLEAIIERVVQEEVWSQTAWPITEDVLTGWTLGLLDPWERAYVLAEARHRLGVGALGWEA